VTDAPPLRVAHLGSGDLWAGAELQLFTLLSELVQRPQFKIRVVLFNHGLLEQKLLEQGLEVVVLDENRLNPFSLLRSLTLTLRDFSPHIVHTHRYKETILGGLASRWAGKPRLIKTVHGLREPFNGWRSARMQLYGYLDRQITARYFDTIIGVSDDIVYRTSPVAGRASVVRIHNGINLERCRASTGRSEVRQSLQIPENSTVLGLVGRLVRVKGVENLLHAAQILKASIPGLRVVVVGDGPEAGSLHALSKALGLEDCVLFTGFRTDVIDLLAAMDALVLSSYSEGVPMIVLEAMAMEIPIVATSVGGIPEILTHGETALLVPSGRPDELANACRRLFDTPGLVEHLTRAARSRVEADFSAPTMADRVARVYTSGLEP